MVAVATARALGAGVQVAVTDVSLLEAARREVLRRLEEFDAALSRFRPDSELSRLNRAAGRPTPVSPLCLRALLAALRVAASTDGIVDPTVGAALECAGYDRDFDLIGCARPAAPGRPDVPGWGCIEVDPASAVVRVPAGVHLDLGASAKALAADECAAATAAAGACGVLVNLGGDIAAAGPAPDGGWHVRVTENHASGTDAPGQAVSINSGGLATSSTTVRQWAAAGGAAHHIIDPRNGLPAAIVWRTVSAAARSCVDANAATTAAVVLGGAAAEWLSLRSIPSRLVSVDGRVRHLCGWPAAGEQE